MPCDTTTSSPERSSCATPKRYCPTDFHRLTNRTIPRRLSSPHFAPDFGLERAHEPPGAKSTGSNSSVIASSLQTVTAHGANADKRVRSSRSSSKTSVASTARGSHAASLKPCVIEDRQGVAQSFLESVTTSNTSRDVHLKESADLEESAETCECCCRCGRSPKSRPLARGSRRSKSYTALRSAISELSGWDVDETAAHAPEPQTVEPKRRQFRAGESPVEKLPVEVLDEIIGHLAIDLPPAGYGPRNVDLISCLLTSKTIHVATINTLYKHITIPHSSIFSKFHHHIAEHAGLGSLVRRLDLSHFTSVGLGRSRQSNSEIQNLTSKTLLRVLEFTSTVQEVLLQENLDDDIDLNLLDHIFFQLPKLRAVDFCASSSLPFAQAFSAVLGRLPQEVGPGLTIKRLSLHECFTLPSTAFERLLPHLTQLTHLDVAHTRVTDRALESIPETARLTHLNLGRCIHITGEGVVDILTSHPAMKELVYLNLFCDVTRYRLLYEAEVDRLLPTLPSTLRSLNLNGAHIHSHHIPHLLPLTRHLEELGISHAEVSLADVNALFRPWPSAAERKANPDTTPSRPLPPTLHYLDLSCIPSITQASLFNTPAPTNILLTPATLPLEVIELGDKAISSLRECKNTNKRLGWCVKELGRRGWYVREPLLANANGPPAPPSRAASFDSRMSSSSSVSRSSASSASSRTSCTTASMSGCGGGNGKDTANPSSSASGRRRWKMGAIWWGMRKCPVAFGEVGGLYGHYMFKK